MQPPNWLSCLGALVLAISIAHGQPPATSEGSAQRDASDPPGDVPSAAVSTSEFSKPSTSSPVSVEEAKDVETQASEAINRALANPNAVLEKFLETAPDDVAAEGKAAKERFEKLRKELTEAVVQMRIIHTKFNNGDADSDEDRDTYFQQRNKVRDLMNQTLDASVEVFQYMPDQLAAQFILVTLEYCEPRDIYNRNTLRGAIQLMNLRTPYSYVYLTAARSAVMLGEFDFAEEVYKTLDEKFLQECDRALIAQLDTLRKQWETESKLRERDAEEDKLPLVKLETTRGDVLIELYIDEAPSTVSHFIQLVEDGFYDGLAFFQVIDRLIALTGDESGDGSGVPDKFLRDEHTREVVRMPMRGSLIMAKAPIEGTSNFVPNSAGTQFAIMYMPFPSINEQQTVFGRVIEGMDVVGAFRRVDPHEKKDKTTVVLPPDRILKAEVVRRPDELPDVQYLERPGPAMPAMPPIAP